MSVFNDLKIVGNVTRDSEVRKFTGKNGENKLTTFGFAHNYKVGDKEETIFFDVDVFGKELSFSKGQRVLVEGSIRDGSYTNKEGEKVNKTKISAVGVYEFGSSKTAAKTSVPSKAKAPVEEVSSDDPPL